MENGSVTTSDSRYPKALKKIGKDAPKVLYYKGEWEKEIFENCLAVVGSRRMTHYGREVISKVVGELAFSGLTIVSGFMYGCDAQAHKTCLKSGGRTIAVMPCGTNVISPEYQEDLYNEILQQKGLVVSEYPNDFKPALWTYPKRNRIVAGLSKAVLVVEAGESSGSLITASWAKRFGRKVFVAPGPITSENSKGIMQLMKQGAEPVSSAEEILEYYKLQKRDFSNHSPYSPLVSLGARGTLTPDSQNSFFPLETKILDRLKRESLAIDDLARELDMSAAEIGQTLSMMELKGQIKQEGSKYCLN